jgi:hypothetical protein
MKKFLTGIAVLLTVFMLAIFAATLLGLLLSCEPQESCSKEGPRRCDNDRVQECRDGEWTTVMDCPEVVGPEYQCCPMDGELGCWEEVDCD